MKKIFIFFLGLYLTLNLYAFESVSLIDSPYPDHKIELLVEKPSNPNFQLLLFLHGASGKGLKGISPSWFDHWLNKGYAIASISMPGYGSSTGRKDFCGPFTLASLNFAIDIIKNKLELTDFGIIGFGQGGLAGILLTSQRSDIRCLVCTNGSYDLFRHRTANDELINILKEKEYVLDIDDDEALRYRSPLLYVPLLHTPIFILHRKGNPIINEEEASDFYHAMQEAGNECHLIIKDKTAAVDAQKLSYEEVLEETEGWVDNLMSSGRDAQY